MATSSTTYLDVRDRLDRLLVAVQHRTHASRPCGSVRADRGGVEVTTRDLALCMIGAETLRRYPPIQQQIALSARRGEHSIGDDLRVVLETGGFALALATVHDHAAVWAPVPVVCRMRSIADIIGNAMTTEEAMT